MRLSKIFIALSVIGFSSFLAAAPANTLVNCVATAPQKLSPAITNDANDFNASSQQIYDRLLAFKAGKIEVEPSLAEKWEGRPAAQRICAEHCA